MVRWDAGIRGRLAGLAVALGANGTSRQRLGHVDVVNAHPQVLVEFPRPIVPPGEVAGFRMESAYHVDHAPVPHPRDRPPLRLRNVGSPVDRGRVVTVVV